MNFTKAGVLYNMDLINCKKLLSHKPTLLHTITNDSNQVVKFYEDPVRGDEYFILGVIETTAFVTDFFDTEDFYKGSDYLPVLKEDGTVICQFEDK